MHTRFSLLPVAEAMPAVEAAVGGANENPALSAAELLALARVAMRYVQTSNVLLRYAMVLSQPNRN